MTVDTEKCPRCGHPWTEEPCGPTHEEFRKARTAPHSWWLNEAGDDTCPCHSTSPRELSPGVAADILLNRGHPVRFLRLGRFVLIWEKPESAQRCPRRACRGRIPHSWLVHWGLRRVA